MFQNDPNKRMRGPASGASSDVPQAGNRTVFQGEPTVSPEDYAKRKARDLLIPQPVDLPDHLYIPKDAQSVDLMRLVLVPNDGLEHLIMSYEVKRGAIAAFQRYALMFNNQNNGAVVTANFYFIPKINGMRIFPEHGDPNDNFKIRALPFDFASLNDNRMKFGYVEVQPYQKIEWYGVNNSVLASTTMGVRMVGFRRSRTGQESTRFGG